MPGQTATIEQVIQALVAFEDLLTPEFPSNTSAFSQARVALAKAVNGFVADEGEQITLLQRVGFAGASDLQQREVYNALIAVRLRYSAHISQWTAARVASEWRRYRADSITLIIAMRKILRERTALLPSSAAADVVH
ncbi:MAG: hypothetical protein ACRYFW_14890 [Janthinobacterium lividum]